MLVVTLSKHFFEGAGEDEIQNGSLFLFGCFFHLTKLWVSFKSPCQIMTENKDSVCVCISTHTHRILADRRTVFIEHNLKLCLKHSIGPAPEQLIPAATVKSPCSLQLLTEPDSSVHYTLCCSAYGLSLEDTVFQKSWD